MQRSRKQPKKPKNYEKNKRAFDSVFSHYRSLLTSTSISAVNIETSGNKPVRNPAKPTPLDFKCDVDKAVKVVVPVAKRRRFYAVYGLNWTDDEIEQGMLADRVLGGVHNSWEQRLGELFARLGLFPVQGRGYFRCVRGQVDKKKA
jgi:hypothetical protein